MANIWKLSDGTVITQDGGVTSVTGDSKAAVDLQSDLELQKMGDRITSPSAFVRQLLNPADAWSVHCWVAEKARENGLEITEEPDIEKPEQFKTVKGRIY